MQSRRDFVKNAGRVAAGAVVLPACTGGGQSSGTGSAQEAPKASGEAVLKANWRVGLQLYTLRDALQQDVKGTIKYISEVGYDELELFGYQNGEYFGMPAKDFYRLVQDASLSVRSAHYLTGRVGADAPGTIVNGWDRAVGDAVSAGQSHMVLSWLPEEERTLAYYQELPELLNEAGRQCREAGLQFAYHNHDFEFQEVPGLGSIPMYHILDNTDPELVKVELDLFWISLAGYDPLEFFNKYPGRTELWHVKDLGERDGEETTVEVGNGRIEFDKIFSEAATAGLQAFFVEQDHSSDPKSSIATSFNNLRKILS